ncbi:Golgi-associated kinase 1B isoform X2 [Antennarius striatus]|uniref:Golgi-associated kinase 1B isoform X2 n=1 Tax=Antennarius striatus TaxID=241820 RepID=UPI0035AE6502
MGKSRCPGLCFSFLKLTSSFRKCPLSKKSLIIASACVVYLLFAFSRVGYYQQRRDRRIYKVKNRNTRGLYNLDVGDALQDSLDLQTGASFVVPTRSNVVYITLRSKRLKPSNIRGTIRPKLRKKLRRTKSADSAFTQSQRAALEPDAGQIKHNLARRISSGETRDVEYRTLDITHRFHINERIASYSSIRIYSQKAPPWLSAHDVETMRFLADAKVLRVKEVSHGDSPSFLMFEGDTGGLVTNPNHTKSDVLCGGRCGVISSPVDTTEVFAFHLDRVLGLNRTLPAVSRKFSFLHGGQSCPVVSWDASLYPEGLVAGWSTVKLTWGEYQNALKQRCWLKNTSPKPDSGCSTVHHYEWSKLALFDFLLQIHDRLDQSCCGFRPRRHDPRRLVFTNNKAFFDRNEDNLDFRLLDGIKEFPEEAVLVLRSMRLREKLLQSLFLDQTYWESQGGRQGIDKLIDVIERRARVLLTYINAHGIRVTGMNA